MNETTSTESSTKEDKNMDASREDKNMAVIMDIAMLFVFMISPLVVYLIKKDSQFIMEQARENINLNITIILEGIVCGVLTLLLIGIIGYIVVGIYFLIVTILAAVANSDGKIYRYPGIIRLLK